MMRFVFALALSLGIGFSGCAAKPGEEAVSAPSVKTAVTGKVLRKGEYIAPAGYGSVTVTYFVLLLQVPGAEKPLPVTVSGQSFDTVAIVEPGDTVTLSYETSSGGFKSLRGFRIDD